MGSCRRQAGGVASVLVKAGRCHWVSVFKGDGQRGWLGG